MMKDWDITAPYLLPRISTLKKNRNNTLPTKIPKPTQHKSTFDEFSARWYSWRRTEFFGPGMIPEPDYSEPESQEESDNVFGSEEYDTTDSELSSSSENFRDTEESNENEDDLKKRITSKRKDKPNKMRGMPTASSKMSEVAVSPRKSQFSEESLIRPKKPSNPYLESTERRMLHKELVFKQKYGQNTVNQRSELQKALEKYTEEKVKKDLAASRQSSLEKILEKQARKIEMYERGGNTDIRPKWIERLQQQHVITRIDPKKDEFFRVHAKVVGTLSRSYSADEDSNFSSDSLSSRRQESSPSDSED